jgi:GNAT superfamily N-acetyltransferase
MDDSVTVARADIRSPAAQRLIGALNAELSGIYPEPGATHFRVDVDEVGEGRGTFVIASKGDTAIACGALRRIDEGVGEVKRMYVVPDERGRGVSRLVLQALEAEARRLGLSRLLLETGVRQSAAIALYERSGFERIRAYGEYVLSPATSVCMAKDLAPAGSDRSTYGSLS